MDTDRPVRTHVKMARPAGLLGAARLALRVAVGRPPALNLAATAKLSNPLVYVVGSNPAANRHRKVLYKFL